jgi:hypothetical protein
MPSLPLSGSYLSALLHADPAAKPSDFALTAKGRYGFADILAIGNK